MNTQAMTIAEVGIRIDAEGRFCLNDLHRAAGGEKRHAPNEWLRLQQTQALIAEIAIPGIPGIESKQGLGTYVVKELVYAYAMWISPTFHLKVIRAYDAMSQQAVARLPDFTDPATAAIAWAEQYRAKQQAEAKAQALEQQAAKDQPKVEAFNRFIEADGLYGINNAARALSIPPRKFSQALLERGYLFREGGNLVPYAAQRDRGLFVVRNTVIDEKSHPRTYITPRGVAYFGLRFSDLIVSPPESLNPLKLRAMSH